MTKGELAKLLDEKLAGLATKDDLETTRKDLDQKFRAIEKRMATKQDLKRLEKKLSEFFDYLDNDVMTDRKRIQRLESHLGLSA